MHMKIDKMYNATTKDMSCSYSLQPDFPNLQPHKSHQAIHVDTPQICVCVSVEHLVVFCICTSGAFAP